MQQFGGARLLYDSLLSAGFSGGLETGAGTLEGHLMSPRCDKQLRRMADNADYCGRTFRYVGSWAYSAAEPRPLRCVQKTRLGRTSRRGGSRLVGQGRGPPQRDLLNRTGLCTDFLSEGTLRRQVMDAVAGGAVHRHPRPRRQVAHRLSGGPQRTRKRLNSSSRPGHRPVIIPRPAIPGQNKERGVVVAHRRHHLTPPHPVPSRPAPPRPASQASVKFDELPRGSGA
ncbi:Altered inheritance of mitochondria protein 21 [Frankliniella fusca]|uniref:Altered inheritance of mitochondria protein 21 n=1 Tax=Frankliniella fusca TaxID=407009 RepID=A0AAE1H083_9NEOP|nr:Altered inheritance of mitochondria protein 21 [Frankliniella fusca]